MSPVVPLKMAPLESFWEAQDEYISPGPVNKPAFDPDPEAHLPEFIWIPKSRCSL